MARWSAARGSLDAGLTAFHPAAFHLLAAGLLVAAALLLAGCGPTSLAPIQADPGIGASLSLVESKTEALFAELERNPSAPFSEYDAIHYRPLLDEITNTQKLANLHKRSGTELQALLDLEATYQRMRREHRESKLSFGSLGEFRTQLTRQLDALQRMER